MRYARPASGRLLEQIRVFLGELGLDWDSSTEFTVALIEDDEIMATGSRQGGVLKCIGVSPKSRGEGLTGAVVTELVKDALQSGHSHLFLFTKPGSATFFEDLGFYPIVTTGDVAFLENRRNGIRRFVDALERPETSGLTGAIVANCNPFTLGHRYLIETAAAACDTLHLFILSEDRSAFSTKARYQLAKEGCADLANVIVHPTADYLISSATFPDYFIKDKTRSGAINTELDLTIFAERFAKPLGIIRRYVGSEPYCPVTSAYNRQMHEVLPRFGIEVIELPRKEQAGEAVSASRVRGLLEAHKLEALRELVPETTYRYLEGMERA